jgi:hypothetical protein
LILRLGTEGDESWPSAVKSARSMQRLPCFRNMLVTVGP